MQNRLIVVSVLLVASAQTSGAQDALARLGLTPASAAAFTNAAVTTRGSSSYTVDQAMRKLFKALPPSARATVTTGVWAWTKSYVNSAAFKAEYARRRTEATPIQPTFKSTVDQELKAKTDTLRLQFAETRKNTAQLPAEQRAQLEKAIKEQEAMLTSERYVTMMKAGIEAERTSARTRYDEDTKRWTTEWPVNPQPVVAQRLREFLAACTDVDFAAKLVLEQGVRKFEKPEYERKPSEWKECFRAGRESHTAARTAAAAWLKEIGG